MKKAVEILVALDAQGEHAGQYRAWCPDIPAIMTWSKSEAGARQKARILVILNDPDALLDPPKGQLSLVADDD